MIRDPADADRIVIAIEHQQRETAEHTKQLALLNQRIEQVVTLAINNQEQQLQASTCHRELERRVADLEAYKLHCSDPYTMAGRWIITASTVTAAVAGMSWIVK